MAEGVEAVAVELQEPAEIEGDSATVSVEIEAAVQQIEHIALEEDRRKAAEADRVEMMNKLEKTLNSSVRYKEMLLKKLSNFDEHQRMERARMEEMRKKKAPVKRASSTRKRKASSSPAGSSGSQSRQQSPKTEEDTIINTQLPKYFTGGDLREYQIDGYRWLHTLYMNGVNGILADEMGLGKTIQAIAVVCSLYENGFVNERPVFIVAPLSTLGNWMREFQKFAPKIPVMIYHGSGAERWPKLAKFRRVHMLDGVKVCPVVISSYEMVLYDSKKLQQFTFSYFIVDEGQRIKNGNSRLHIALKSLNLQQRLLMTGTPLQNNLTELWALLNFLMPQIFNNCLWFLSFFDFSEVLDAGCEDDERKRIVMQKEKENQMVRKLHDILAAFMLRREKTNVGLSLPAKKEILVYCPVTVKQRQMYMEYLTGTVEIMRRGFNEKPEELIVTGKRNRKNRVDMAKVIAEDDAENWDFDEIDENAEPERDENGGDEPQMILRYNKRSLLSTMVTLRKISMHPQLIEWHADKATGEYEINDDMIKLSGKMLVLDRMLKELKRRGHKVLLFSQMTQMLDILHDYCDYRDYKCARLDGSYSLKVREENIADFSENHDTFVFLLSTRAGGLGLNLVAADTVIFYDSDWNPQMDLQAQDRCHRIGQTRPVVVYRLASKGTIDESIIKRARQKRRLERIVIQSERFTLNSSEAERLSPEDLRQLLESVDHSSMFQAAEDGDVISDADLKQLLDRSDLKNVENIKKAKKEKTDAFVVLNVETE